MKDLIDKMEELVRKADMRGENIAIAYDREDGFWIGKIDRWNGFKPWPDPDPFEGDEEKTHKTLKEAIEAVA